ncbi:MAG: Asp-tRNA(Asn)/Glu-tRNA(Gln) amidotransferase subunit GatA [Planctomycetes bacterium]|nr:Asp-tRNA(Asn)/Glu-tRNA(Gln) amidotransferase subunit GatA [Planctomycetota bacterium]
MSAGAGKGEEASAAATAAVSAGTGAGRAEVGVRGPATAREIAARAGGDAGAARDALGRIARHDGAVRAFLVSGDGAPVERAAAGQGGALAGVPVAVKDNISTRAFPTTCASKILAGYRPAYDAAVVERIEAAGGVVVGKTNLDEFAMGSSTENSGVGPTRNPWDLSRAPGGSSGGSAAAVAAGMVPLALGSDTGGSIRQPAALCGVVGLKPTYGLVAFGSSLDQIGPLARTVSDAALLLSVIAGHDPRDSTSLDAPPEDYLSSIDGGVRGLRLGLPREYFGEGLDGEVGAAVRTAVEFYRGAGAQVREVSLPHTKYGIAAYYIVATAEASSNLARYDGVHYGPRAQDAAALADVYFNTRSEGFGAEVKRRIMLGTFTLSSGYYDAYYLKGLKVRTLIRRDFDRAFEAVDAILCPTSPTAAFTIGEKTSDPLQMYLCDVYTVCCNLAGIPGVSLPCGFTSGGLPIGLQVLGRHLDEKTILRVARAFEAAHGFENRVPAAFA